jgi:DNA-binding response OmpR family regulator
LIVSEDPETSDGLTLVLESANHIVRTVRNGAEALREIRTCRPDLILIDLVPPTNDSWTFRVRQLRDPELEDIPLVVLADCREASERENSRFGRALPGHDVLDFVGDVLQLLEEGAAV